LAVLTVELWAIIGMCNLGSIFYQTKARKTFNTPTDRDRSPYEGKNACRQSEKSMPGNTSQGILSVPGIAGYE
jgi:hypothetical protein